MVAVYHHQKKWTVVWRPAQAAVPRMGGRDNRANRRRQGLWIFLVAQLIAVVLVLFAVFFKWLLVLGLVACAVVGLAILWFDRR